MRNAPKPGKSPAFQIYPKDFLADENVAAMTLEEVGCYWLLLCYCWNERSLPNDLKRLARLLKIRPSHMARLWEAVGPCFVEDENGRLVNRRLQQERSKQEAFRENRSVSGKKGALEAWRRRRSKSAEINGTPMAQSKHSHDSATTQPMANDGSSVSSETDMSSSVMSVGSESRQPNIAVPAVPLLTSARREPPTFPAPMAGESDATAIRLRKEKFRADALASLAANTATGGTPTGGAAAGRMDP
jgi:uncharacterized protein YdaU (DUF1376 family)